MFQRFRFSYSGKGVTLRFADQFIDPLDHPPVLLLPVEVVFPCLVGEDQLHAASSRSVPWSAFSCVAAESSRLALVGVRRR